MVMKKIMGFALAFMFSTALFAQGITTASAYFKQISEYYGTLKDYEVEFELKVNKKDSSGTLCYKSPNLIRLDYTKPADQVIVFNGDKLIVYLSEQEASLEQEISSSTGVSPVSTTTPQSLALMTRYYTVAYETGQDAVPLDDGSNEMVIKFILERKSTSEAFKYLKIAVSEGTNLIRRLEAVTPKGDSFIFNFYEYKVNSGITDQRFIYDAPATADVYSNFLFSE